MSVQTEHRNPTDASVIRACNLVFRSEKQAKGAIEEEKKKEENEEKEKQHDEQDNVGEQGRGKTTTAQDRDFSCFLSSPKLPPSLKPFLGYVALTYNLSLDAFIAAVILFVDDLLVLSLVFMLSCARYEQAIFCNGTLLDAVQRKMCPLDADQKLCRIILPGFADAWGPGDHQVLRIGKLVGTMLCLMVKITGLWVVTFWKSSVVTGALRTLLQMLCR